MDHEERRLAMLRQRGELEEETAQPEEEIPKKRKKSVNPVRRKPHSRKNKGKSSLSSRRAYARRRQQRQELLRRCIYLGALIVIILVIVTVVKGCGSEGTLPANASAGETGESTEVSGQEETVSRQTVEAPDSQAEEIPTTEAAEVQTVQPSAETTAAVTSQPVSSSSPSGDWPVDISGIVYPEWIEQDFIRVNEYSRPQMPLTEIKYIAIHYVSNPNTTAKNNRNYFDHLGDPEDPFYASRYASAHFVVGLEGEVVQCLPLNEWANAVHDEYNPYTISIEVCHPDATGEFTEITKQGLIRLTAWVMQQFDLDGDSLLRHYDCDQKACPKFYVENPDEWTKLKQQIIDYNNTHPDIS